MAVFRLIQNDTRRINQIKPPKITWSKPASTLQYDKNLAARTFDNPDPAQIRTLACYFKDNSHTIGRYCKTQMVTASIPIDRKHLSLMPSTSNSGLVSFRAGSNPI